MQDFVKVTKALSDENRVRILMFLRDGELCLCQVMEILGLSTSTDSKHMSILRQARLVDSRKDGRWMYYRLPGRGATKPVREVLAWVRRSLAESPQADQDRRKLEKILAMDPEELCKSR